MTLSYKDENGNRTGNELEACERIEETGQIWCS